MHDPHFSRAQRLYESHRYEQALEEIQYHLAGAPDAAEGHCLAAWCLWRLKRFLEATERAREAIASEPEWAQPYCLLARILKERNRLPEAQAAIEQALRLDPDEPSQYVVQAIIQVRQGKFADAVRTAENGLEIDPTHDDCRSVRALALSLLGRNEEALASSKEVLADDPEGPFTHASRGWVLLRAHQPQRAREHFLEALRMMPDYEWAREGLVLALSQQQWLYRFVIRIEQVVDRMPGYVRLPVLSVLGVPFVMAIVAFAVFAPRIAGATLGLVIWGFWCWGPISLTLLWRDRFGRTILSDQERAIAVAFLSLGGLGWLTLILGLLVGWDWLAMFGGALALLARPLTDLLRCDAGAPRWKLIGYLLFILGLGVALVVAMSLGDVKEKWTGPLVQALVFSIIFLPYVARKMAAERARR